MNGRNYRTYTEEFKIEALGMLQSSGKKVGEIEHDLDITPGLLRKWRDRYQTVRPGTPTARREPKDLETAKREIHRLERELKEIAEEREILKKVVNIFSRKSA